jgi:cytochrome b561
MIGILVLQLFLIRAAWRRKTLRTPTAGANT